MKIVFFFALLINIIFFLWEYNSAGVTPPDATNEIAKNETKQILLVSEIQKKEQEQPIFQASNDAYAIEPENLAEQNILKDTISDQENNEIDQLITEVPNLVDDEKNDNESVSTDAIVKDELSDESIKASNIDLKELTNERMKQVEKNGLVSIDAKVDENEKIKLSKLNPTINTVKPKAKTFDTNELAQQMSSPVVADKFELINNPKVNDESLKNIIESAVKEPDEIELSLKKNEVFKFVRKKKVVSSKIVSDGPNHLSLPEIKPGVKQNSESNTIKTKLKKKLNPKRENVFNAENNSKSDEIPAQDIKVRKDFGHARLNKAFEEKQAQLVYKYCYDIGPFEDQNAFDDWRKLNLNDAITVNMINKNESKASSFLVYYPAAENYQASKKNVDMLKRMGITDYWLFRKGPLRGSISLGLFTKESRALRFKSELANQGLDVEIKQSKKVQILLYAQITTTIKKFKESVNISQIQTISACENPQPVS